MNEINFFWLIAFSFLRKKNSVIFDFEALLALHLIIILFCLGIYIRAIFNAMSPFWIGVFSFLIMPLF
jgi:hypothetical protein